MWKQAGIIKTRKDIIKREGLGPCIMFPQQKNLFAPGQILKIGIRNEETCLGFWRMTD